MRKRDHEMDFIPSICGCLVCASMNTYANAIAPAVSSLSRDHDALLGLDLAVLLDGDLVV